ncbi:MAG: hypothetical protein ABSB90_04355 [Thermoplasmata archaeon]|jgi:hypothetical protein
MAPSHGSAPTATAAIPPVTAAPTRPAATVGSSASTASAASAGSTPSATSSTGDLALGANTLPSAICAGDTPNCPAGTGLGRVTLTASPASNGGIAWPAVQIAFVIETTPYAGTGDPSAGEYGTDPCDANPTEFSPMCEESNGVPFFVANAQTIANAISVANPHSQVSFALVDFFATYDDGWDDGDGAEYHVDIQQFVPASSFGADVRATFQASVLDGSWYYPDNDLADNMLSSSSITALYGTIIGSGLSWSDDTHHVIVYMGTSAPQDPSYIEDYYISMSQEAVDSSCSGLGCYDATCEPAYVFANGIQPQCEGWVTSQNGNASDSIAALAHEAPACTGSVGHTCTIDFIDYNSCTTDPYCKSWPTGRGPNSGPGSLGVITDVDHILLAGCDLSAATGGSWDGPSWFTCPDGQSGNLQYVPHGLTNQPNTANPSLLQALRGISFGPVSVSEIAKGTGAPVFTFVPFGHIALAPNGELNATTSCLRLGTAFPTCQKVPTVITHNGQTYLAWNWSTNVSSNAMFVGDYWTASFNVVATGAPYATVPVDACTTDNCKAAGSGALDGLFTWANYLYDNNATTALQSFPLTEVAVENGIVAVAVPPPPPPAPPPPPPPGVAVVTPVGVPQQVGIGQTVAISNVSLQGVAAGAIAAGATQVGMRNKPLRIATMSSGMKNALAENAARKNPTFGRWE